MMSNGEQKSIQDDDILIEELFLELNYNEKIILKIISCLALNISIEYMMIADCLADSIKEKNEIITALNSLVSNGWLEKDGEDICLNYLLAEEIKNNLKLDCDLSGKILLTKLMQYVSFIYNKISIKSIQGMLFDQQIELEGDLSALNAICDQSEALINIKSPSKRPVALLMQKIGDSFNCLLDFIDETSVPLDRNIIMEKALYYYQKAILLAEKETDIRAKAYIEKARIYFCRGNKNDAVQNINNVINEMDYSDTNQLDTLLSVASLYYESDMFEKAIEIYSVALNRFVLGKHEKSIIYRQLSEIYRLLKDYDKAIANLELAFEILEPNSIEKEYLRDRNFEEALEYCSRNHSVSAEFDLKGLIFKEFSRIYELNNSDIYG